MSRARELPQRVVVAGDGPVGILAAVGLRRALPSTEVIIVGTPPDPAAFADRAPSALPFTNRLHDRLGISEDLLVREAGASHRLVVAYRGWGGAEHTGVAPYGAVIDPRLRTGFARAWGAGPRNASGPRPAGSLGEILAAEGRFQPLDNVSVTDADHALRWNMPAYRDALVAEATKLGIRHAPGAIAGVEPDGQGGLASVTVEGGAISADLFLDCTGPRADLLSRLPDARRGDWGTRLPIRSVLLGQPGEPVVSLADRILLHGPGWLSELAGRDGRQAVLALPENVSEQAALEALPTEPLSMIRLAPGCAEQPWLGNVVALGDAAAHFEPLAWLNLDLAHRQLDLLLDLLPGREMEPRERAEFNRRAKLMADGVCNLLGAHYAAPAAAALFPDLVRTSELERMLDQFTRRGRLPFSEDAPLLTQELSALLHALGYPSRESALMMATDPRETEAARTAFEVRAAATLRAMPPYTEWLGSVLGR